MIIFVHTETGGTAFATSMSATIHSVVEKNADGSILTSCRYDGVSKDRVVKCLAAAGYDVSILDTF